MIDLGIDKLALIGAVALIVIGPERLPRVARTVGHLIGKAQRYVADVKAEVNRSIELDELRKMKSQVEGAAQDIEQSIRNEANAVRSEVGDSGWAAMANDDYSGMSSDPIPTFQPKKKNWRIKRGAMPQWYKQRHGVKTRALSGAARVARYRPPKTKI